MKQKYPDKWDVDSVEEQLKKVALPETINLEGGTVITDMKLFVDSHIKTARHNNGNPTYRPYYDRLLCLTKLISNQ